MSNRWPGGLIRKTPVTPAGPLQSGAAPGMWTLAEASYWVKQGLWPTQGNILVVEDVFSTYLYTGNGATQTITNGINLSGQGGLVWLKARTNTSGGATSHALVDTVRGASSWLASEATSSANTNANLVTGFLTSGFSVGNAPYWGNENAIPYVSWTFREAPNFFDVVTYTGNAVAGRAIAHSLGSAPGCIIVKELGNASSWFVYHRSLGATNVIELNITGASYASSVWNNASPTATEFYLGSGSSTNRNGGTYVAYLYAHVTGSDGIIQCGSYTGNGSSTGPVVTLGWEPQWILVKRSDSSANWFTIDNMRGWSASTLAAGTSYLSPNTAFAEDSAFAPFAGLSATGFQLSTSNANLNASGSPYIYIAIRRGPMRTPTLGTSVFSPVANSSAINASTPVSLVPPASDLWLSSSLTGAAPYWQTRLMGWAWLRSSSTSAEDASYTWTQRTQSDLLPSSNWWSAGISQVNYFFRRAPGFFDVVCYTGTGSATTFNHNLGVVPELMIVKRRETTGSWIVGTTFGATTFTEAVLNSSDAGFFISYDNLINAAPTSTTFSVGSSSGTNGSGSTYVAYLFASVPGVSKVGSYTGNGSSQTINCAFTTGARFVMIKRTDSTGDWYVWDSARGIVAGNDPYLALNSTAAEVTSNDSVDTDNTGFVVNQVAASNINVSAATYIFLAIA